MLELNRVTEEKQNSEPSLLNVWSLAGEIGLIIALPIVALVFLGVKIDRLLETTPLFIICGMILATVISVVTIWRKIKRLM